ncbi:MAG TPA: histidine kinase dimerization/phospho-acceptor domain-containing protein, partial [Bacteroidales bacterium]|nr:histidine kinase dimerization/phospho-acceptor domain-containing protein [Bacteroidales bacterium]
MKIQFLNYRLLVWMLLLIAIILGGGYLVTAYSYNLQKETEHRIDMARQSVSVAKEMETELVRMRGFTLTYMVDKSQQWIDSINARETRFIILLERARLNAEIPEENQLIQQISALFSNYRQNLISAAAKVKIFQYRQADALIAFSAKDLIGTILEKSRRFILLNTNAEAEYEKRIDQTNTIILRTMISLGLGGILAGLLLGWIISRMVLKPIHQLILQVRGASGGAFLEKLEVSDQDDLEDLGRRIRTLIERINKTQEDLEKNRELLQYSNKYAVLGKVAPTLAHEIRNPLASIKMLVYSIKEEGKLMEGYNQDLEIISKEIDRMEAFIRNFLKFAKPAEPSFEIIDPVEVLHEVIQLVKPNLKKNQIELELRQVAERHKVSGDSSQLKQVFMNLIINAIEVMPNGGKLIFTIRPYQDTELTSIENQTRYLSVNIEDFGPGIPEKVMKNLFEPFIKG